MVAELDDLDHAILYELQRDARQPVEAIAERVDASPAAVERRTTAMEEQGVLRGYHADVDYDEADVQHYYFFRCSARVSQRERLAERVQDQVGVVEVITLMTGRNNLLVLGTGTQKDDITGLAYDIDGLGVDVEAEALVRSHARQPYETFRLAAGRRRP